MIMKHAPARFCHARRARQSVGAKKNLRMLQTKFRAALQLREEIPIWELTEELNRHDDRLPQDIVDVTPGLERFDVVVHPPDNE